MLRVSSKNLSSTPHFKNGRLSARSLSFSISKYSLKALQMLVSLFYVTKCLSCMETTPAIAHRLEITSIEAATYCIIFYSSDKAPQKSKQTIEMRMTIPKMEHPVAIFKSRVASMKISAFYFVLQSKVLVSIILLTLSTSPLNCS